MAVDLPSVSYLALYVVSIHVLDTSSRTSTHWRLNSDTGKVEVAALAADGDANSPTVGFPNDPLLNMLTSRVSLANGEWRLEAEPPSCYDNCRRPDKPAKSTDNKNFTRSLNVRSSVTLIFIINEGTASIRLIVQLWAGMEPAMLCPVDEVSLLSVWLLTNGNLMKLVQIMETSEVLRLKTT
jgi:hypothetical protein